MAGTTALLTALGLSRSPFPPTPDAESYFFTPHLQEQFAEVMHCIEARKGFILLTGEVGLGKSTLVRRLLNTLDTNRTSTALVFNTFLQESALLAAVLRDFGLVPCSELEADLATLNNFLLQSHRDGKTCLLVIDDAQNLSIQSLELIRLLCNLETGQEKLLQILLAGQPELETILAGSALRQLKSRIIKHARLHGLSAEEMGRYFEFRTTAAGGAGRISLAPAAARLLYQATAGNLRQIHLVLDRCLYGLAATGKGLIDMPLLAAALKDVSLQSSVSAGLWRSPRVVAAGLICTSALAGAGLMYASRANWTVSPVVAATVSAHPPARKAPSVPTPQATTPVSAPVSAPALASIPAARALSASEPQAAPVPTSCLQQLASSGQAVVSQWLPAPVVQRLKAIPGVCLTSRDEKIWVSWHADPASAQARLPMVSEATRAMQSRLVHLGWLESSLVDGMNGPKTRAALESFQRSMGLPVIGRPDELTYMLLEKLNAS